MRILAPILRPRSTPRYAQEEKRKENRLYTQSDNELYYEQSFWILVRALSKTVATSDQSCHLKIKWLDHEV